MRKSIRTYIDAIERDYAEFIVSGGYASVAEYVIMNAENGMGWHEFFDANEYDDDPTNEQIDELKKYLQENYDYLPAVKAYLGAIATWNADPYLVETEEETKAIAMNVTKHGLREIKDEAEFETAKAQLDLKDARHIYKNGYLTICFAEDWDAN